MTIDGWEESLVCGLMSGTSVDGIDAAIFRVSHRGSEVGDMHLLAGLTQPLPDAVRDEILALFDDPAGGLERLAVLNMVLGELFADAVLAACHQAGIASRRLRVIGSHGQTIRHVASPRTLGDQSWRASLQIAEGSLIAQRCAAPVVWNFRPADIAAGGTGAPLVPFLDRILADRLGEDTAFLNIGGIANICAFMPGCIAFDTGPGNMIADRLAATATGQRLRYDRDGELGTRGRIIPGLTERWLEADFFHLPPPKSAGREEFGSRFWENECQPRLAAADLASPWAASSPATSLTDHCDLIRTCEHFTARAVELACRRWLPRLPRTLVVSGGGARNPLIMADLAQLLAPCQVHDSETFGISIDFKEAQAFALMALFTLQGLACTIPGATGATRAVPAGTLSLP